MRKITKDEFQSRLGNGFEILEYEGYNKYIKVKCLSCKKEIEYKIAKNLSLNPKCPKCSGYRKTTEEWIKEAVKIHGDKYDYSNSEYKTNKDGIKIFCKRCGEYFFQRPTVHLKSCGHSCYKKEILSENAKSCTEEFVEKMERKFPNKYSYKKIKYVNNTTKVQVFCKKCKDYFWQQPYKLLIGYGCSNCALERSIETRKISLDEFKKRSNIIHHGLYNYNKAKFDKTIDEINIYCNSCKRYFSQTVASHLSGSGCPFCKKSIGEKIIKKYFDDNKINYTQNKTFVDLKDIGNLSYDFYLKDYNMLIEYNGIQHYEFKPYFHKTLHDFHKQLHHDWLKRKYARKNNIKLMVVSYKENLDEFLRRIKQ